jgi:YesN/AraC family two-component response regulator
MLEEQWREMLDLQAVGSNTEPGSIAFLINVDTRSEDEYRNRMRLGIEDLEDSFESVEDVHLVVTLSGVFHDLEHAPSRYTEAKSVHDYQRTARESGLVFAPDLAHKLTNRALFDLESEMSLSRSVVSGNREKTTSLLSELRDSAASARNLAPHSIELLLEQLEGALLRTLGALVFSDPEVQGETRSRLAAARAQDEFEGRFDQLADAFSYLCHEATSAGERKHIRLIAELKRYLEEHHASSQLGLAMVAEAFRLSPGYVSRFFKENAGVGLAEYLERYRIGRAMEALVDTATPISEIAAEVGYTNPNTFYKAFRRITGVSAGEFRQRGKGGNDQHRSIISTPNGAKSAQK